MTTSTLGGELVGILDAHRLETTLLQVRVERLTAVLREHGLPIPGDDPRLGASDGEHLEQCRQVVNAAYELLTQLRTLERMVGSGMEFVKDDQSWRAS